MSIANEVSAIESEVESLRADNKVQAQHIAVLEWENGQLRQSLARTQTERDNAIRGRDAIKVLLDQCGASLVSGIQKYHANEREAQATALGVGEDEPPKFISNAQKMLQETMN